MLDSREFPGSVIAQLQTTEELEIDLKINIR